MHSKRTPSAPASGRRPAFGLACLLLACASSLFALNPSTPPGNYSIQVWTTEHGLPSNKIRAITQAPDGYLWVATAQGLARFDGFSFTIFNGSTNPELLGGGFYAARAMPDGTLWFGGDNGLFRWNGGGFDHYTVENGLPHNYVRALCVAKDGTLVICTRMGFAMMRDGKINVPGGEWKQITGVARSYLERADGTTLLGTDDGLWSMADGTIRRIGGTPEWEGNGYAGLIEAPDGSLWIGYNRGLRHILADGSFENINAFPGLTNPRVSGLLLDRDGNLWISAYGGLVRMTGGRLGLADYPQQIAGAALQLPFEDNEGNFWLSTSVGLVQLRNNINEPVGPAQGLDQTSVYCVNIASDGTWWVGVWAGGVYLYDGRQATRLKVPRSLNLDQILTIAEEPAGTMWIGASSGLFRYSGGVTSVLYDPALVPSLRKQISDYPGTLLSKPAHSRINSIATDGTGGLWVATDGALYNGHEGAWRAYTTADGLPGNTFKSVIRASNGDIWATVPPEGVVRFKDGVWTTYRAGEQISSAYPRGVREDSQGTIWVTTEGGGLNRFKDGRWHVFTVKDGLADNFISAVVEDAAGFLWIACPSHTMRVPLKDFDEVAAGVRNGLGVKLFNARDGLLSAECNQQGTPNALRTPDGRLVFCTDKGLNVIHPDRVTGNTLAPPVHIERLTAAGRDYDLSKPVSIAPGSGNITISYTAISLLAPGKIQFKTRLSPLDGDWVDEGGRRELRYAKLPPGDYTLQVIACNGDDVWNREGATLAFTVRPFFYQTWWFTTAVALVLAGSATAAYRVRIRRIKRKAAELQQMNIELERRIAERTAELAKSNETLQASEYFYHSLVESLPQIIARKDSSGRYTYVNTAFCELVGRPLDAVIGHDDNELYPPETAAKQIADDRRVLETRRIFEYEIVPENGAANRRYLHVKKVPLIDRDGNPLGVQLLFWDMTQFRETEVKLQMAQEELVEASRMAGIADMATGILHNLGNVLNSVNTSALLAINIVRKSRISGVSKVAQLLEEQKDRLSEFFTSDQRGHQLPGYIDQLSHLLQEEQATLTRELNIIQNSVDHIKEVVATQQKFAHVGGLIEAISPVELVEYAIRLNEASLTRHKVTVVREFMTAPKVKVERQKVLQILINLIRNAKEAINETGRTHKQIILGVGTSDRGWGQIYISDNGVGIVPENITKMFSFGFTTKPTGHGFGLHSSALAATELGGSLRASSEGPGKGATFTLELPPADADTPAGLARK